MRLLLAGGGTGGHLFPAVALAERLLETDPDSSVHFVGTDRGIEARILPQLGWPLSKIDISGFVGKGIGGKIALIPQLWKSLRQSRRILDTFNPDVVVGVGGYASGPVLMAAAMKKIPYLVHEQNAWPGLTNRMLARWAQRICISFAESEKAFPAGKTVLTGNPLRRGMESCPMPGAGKPLLLVFGGSRGARAINDAVVSALGHMTDMKNGFDILHQSGDEDLQRIRDAYAAMGWDSESVVPFIHDMADAYGRAHLLVCRAGATTLAELTACGRAAILIPYPYAAGDHQSANARALVLKGAALMVPQSELDGESLATLIRNLLHDHNQLVSMASAARALSIRGAADSILQQCRDVIG